MASTCRTVHSFVLISQSLILFFIFNLFIERGSRDLHLSGLEEHLGASLVVSSYQWQPGSFVCQDC
jgi:hypothetical protein